MSPSTQQLVGLGAQNVCVNDPARFARGHDDDFEKATGSVRTDDQHPDLVAVVLLAHNPVISNRVEGILVRDALLGDYGSRCPAAVNSRYHSSRESVTSDPAADSATRSGLVVPSTTCI